MRSPPLRLASLLLALLLVSTAPLAFSDNEQKTRQQLNKLNTEMGQLRKLLKRFKGQRSELQNSLRKSEVAIGSLQTKISSIQRQLATQQAELQSLNHRRGELQTAQRKQQKFINQQILSAYQIGRQKKLKVLLNQEQPDKVSRALTYYDYFNRARSEQIEEYIDVISELDTIEPRIVEKTSALSQAKRQLSQEHKKLVGSKADRERSLTKINASIKNKDQSLKRMSKDRLELEKLLAAVEQTIANIDIPSDYRPFKNLKGKLPWPVKGKPSNRFGSKRSGGELRWQGVSIPAREGSEIKAIHHGRVVFADWFRGSGFLIIVDHGDGYMSLYAHNQSLLRETGEWVMAGETVATAGNSGGQKRAGLYFEIRHNGRPTDPRRWCKRV